MTNSKERDNMMYSFDKSNIKAMNRRLNNFSDRMTFQQPIPNNMERKRPDSRVSMSNSKTPFQEEERSSSSLNLPKGYKNSGVFNYQTGTYETNIGPDMTKRSTQK